MVAVMLAAGLGYLALQGTGLVQERYYQSVEDDSSAAAHLSYWQAGFTLAVEHSATGMGHNEFNEAFLEYASDSSSSELVANKALQLASTGEREAHVHNDFLNVWLSWGILVVLLPTRCTPVCTTYSTGALLSGCTPACQSP
jgi:hypothetical protein